MTAQVSIDLSGAHLSYSDFEDASFQGNGAIKLDGAGLAHADLSGLTVSAVGARRHPRRLRNVGGAIFHPKLRDAPRPSEPR